MNDTVNGSVDRVKEALEVLKKTMQNDPSYARSWHDNIAVMMQDAGCEYEVSNDGAARFMKLAFGIDTTKKKE